jgi:hypothetical protein
MVNFRYGRMFVWAVRLLPVAYLFHFVYLCYYLDHGELSPEAVWSKSTLFESAG